LAGAIENGTARHFEPGESLSVTIKAVAYTGVGPVTGIDVDGAVSRG
jgi:urease beta subunit